MPEQFTTVDAPTTVGSQETTALPGGAAPSPLFDDEDRFNMPEAYTATDSDLEADQFADETMRLCQNYLTFMELEAIVGDFEPGQNVIIQEEGPDGFLRPVPPRARSVPPLDTPQVAERIHGPRRAAQDDSILYSQSQFRKSRIPFRLHYSLLPGHH